MESSENVTALLLWLKEAWLGTLITGIISGLIVFLVTRWFFADTTKAEFRAKINLANQEVVYAVRQGIPEGVVATTEVITSLIKSTARKYGLNQTELNSVTEVSQDLIKEVMDSSFISAETKNQYCLQLRALEEVDEGVTDPATKRATFPSSYRASNSAQTSILLGFSIMSGFFMSVIFLITTGREIGENWIGSFPASYELSFIFSIVILSISLGFGLVVIQVNRRRLSRASEAEELYTIQTLRDLVGDEALTPAQRFMAARIDKSHIASGVNEKK